MLDLLTEWLGLEHDEARSGEERRAIVRMAPELMRRRGTKAGLELALALAFPGVPFRVEDAGAVTWSLDLEEEEKPAPPSFVVYCDVAAAAGAPGRGGAADRSGQAGPRELPAACQGAAPPVRRVGVRVCRSCGRENPDESDFCTCGEYLRWEPTNFLPSVAAPDAQTPQSNGAAVPTPAEAATPGGATAGAPGAAGAAPRSGGSAGGHPMSPQDLDPNITLGPEMIAPGPRRRRGRGHRRAAARCRGAVAAPAR